MQVPQQLSLIWPLITPAALAGFMWNSDKLISDSGAKILWEQIFQTVERPESSTGAAFLEEFLDEYLSPKNGLPSFFAYVFTFTSLSLLILLAIYSVKMTGLVEQLLTKGFLIQFIGNGFVVVFLTNCAIFLTYKGMIRRFVENAFWKNILLVIVDILLKAILFICLTAVTYVLLTLTTPAFGGHVDVALLQIPITIGQAALFKNLTAVYIYSLVISSFPIYVVLVVRLMILSASFRNFVKAVLFWLPINGKPLRTASVFLTATAGLFALMFASLLLV